MWPTHVWRPAETESLYTIPKSRGSSITLTGAISNYGRFFYRFSPTTDKESTMEFLKWMRDHTSLRNKVIYMDLHPAHKSKEVWELLKGANAIVEFAPPGSSQFNPIGKCNKQSFDQ